MLAMPFVIIFFGSLAAVRCKRAVKAALVSFFDLGHAFSCCRILLTTAFQIVKSMTLRSGLRLGI